MGQFNSGLFSSIHQNLAEMCSALQVLVLHGCCKNIFCSKDELQYVINRITSLRILSVTDTFISKSEVLLSLPPHLVIFSASIDPMGSARMLLDFQYVVFSL